MTLKRVLVRNSKLECKKNISIQRGFVYMFFITAMTNVMTDKDRFDSEKAKKHTTRCFGYFKDKEVAIEAVKDNVADMWETMYDYIVIEEIDEGIHSFAEVVGWFKYNKEKDKYEPIEIGRTGFCNYAIG